MKKKIHFSDDEVVDEDEEKGKEIVHVMENSETESDSDYDKRNDKDFTPRTAKQHVQFGGSNPVRSCRMGNKTQMYADMVTSHYLRRPTKPVNYCEDDYDEEKPARGPNDDDDDWSRKNRYVSKLYSPRSDHELREHKIKSNHQPEIDLESVKKSNSEMINEDRVYLIDFGLALKFVDSSGTHRPFIMDQRRAHDGTLEFTSRKFYFN